MRAASDAMLLSCSHCVCRVTQLSGSPFAIVKLDNNDSNSSDGSILDAQQVARSLACVVGHVRVWPESGCFEYRLAVRVYRVHDTATIVCPALF